MPGQDAAAGVVSRTACGESSAACVSKSRTLREWLRAGWTLSVWGCGSGCAIDESFRQRRCATRTGLRSQV